MNATDVIRWSDWNADAYWNHLFRRGLVKNRGMSTIAQQLGCIQAYGDRVRDSKAMGVCQELVRTDMKNLNAPERESASQHLEYSRPHIRGVAHCMHQPGK